MDNPKKLYFQTLEPVHVGAGGYRLGRVDKTICREPGTNLPKIPGTSLSGAARSYAAMIAGRRNEASGVAEYKGSKEDKACPIFYTFGHAAGGGEGNAGAVALGDAHILFFPIHSTKGCVWITTCEMLQQVDPGAAADLRTALGAKQALIPMGFLKPDEPGKQGEPGFSLGWAWVAANQTAPYAAASLLPNLPQAARPGGHVLVVHDTLIAPLINSNLEVRTSVAINPSTGTALDGKLFSYEAIPRNTYLVQEIVVDDYRKTFGKLGAPWNWATVEQVVEAGLEKMELLGVGGMGTRGFGRMKLLNRGAQQK